MVTLTRPQSMKGFVLQPCDLICEPASPALSEARERQVAKSAAVINPSRLHPTLRRDPLRSPLFFSSWGKYLLHELVPDCISVAGVAILLYIWRHRYCCTYYALTPYMLCSCLVLFCSLIVAFVIEGIIGVTSGQSDRIPALRDVSVAVTIPCSVCSVSAARYDTYHRGSVPVKGICT